MKSLMSSIRSLFRGPMTYVPNPNEVIYLDFENGVYRSDGKSSLDDITTFSRSGVANYWDSSGVLQEAAAGELRFTYDPSDNSFEGVMLEESRTNEVLDNRDLTTANWSGAATVARDEAGIDGVSNTACTVSDTDTGAFEDCSQDITVTDDSLTHTVSFFIKKTSGATVLPLFRAYFSGGTTELKYSVLLDTNDGDTDARGDATTLDYKVIDFGNWWRLEIYAANNGTGNTTLAPIVFPAFTDNGLAGTADSSVTGDVVVDYIQVEIDEREASSPIKTGASAVTRVEDNLHAEVDIGGQGSVFCSVTPYKNIDYGGRSTYFDISDGTSQSRVFAHGYISDQVDITADGESGQKTLSGDVGANKVGCTFSDGYIELVSDGSFDSSDSGTVGVIPNFNRCDIGHSSYWSIGVGLSKIKKLVIWNERKSTTELEELTS